MPRKRAMIAIWVDDCADSDEAVRWIRLFNGVADKLGQLYGRQCMAVGEVKDPVGAEDGAIRLPASVGEN